MIVRFTAISINDYTIKQEVVTGEDRPRINNKAKKLLFFLRREGISQTLRKIRSKKFEATLPPKFATVISTEHNGEKIFNYSTQRSNNPAHFVVKNAWVKSSAESHDDYLQFVHEPNDYLELPLKDQKSTNPIKAHDTGVFVYGLGDYSRVYIAPHLKNLNKVFCVDYNQHLVDWYKGKIGFEAGGLCFRESIPHLKSISRPLCIIATYHSDHALLAQSIFQVNPNAYIFIEKPPTVTDRDLETLIELYVQGANIAVGYNRREIPLNKFAKEIVNGQKFHGKFWVKEIPISKSHWYHWPNQGTRITGNLTHWIDLAIFLNKTDPTQVSLTKPSTDDQPLTASIKFMDGSKIDFEVADEGNSLRGVQEKITLEIGEERIFIDDYLTGYYKNKKTTKPLNRKLRDKGHAAMYKNLIENYNNEDPINYDVDDLIKSHVITTAMVYLYQATNSSVDLKPRLERFREFHKLVNT